MHQHPRPPPLTASPASSPKTNPMRTNNSREESLDSLSNQKNTAPPVEKGREEVGNKTVSVPHIPSKDALRKLDQIIQNFHTKAAILVLQSRIWLPPIIVSDGTKKVNKWFQIETDDTNSFRHELHLWRHCGSYSDRPPPLIIETYIDFSNLNNSQSLVILDDKGKRWDVLEAINNASGGDLRLSRSREVILERWKFELRDLPNKEMHDFGSILPTVYKKFIVFFRSLFATTKFVPAGKLLRTLAKNGFVGSPVKINCRILNGRNPSNVFDALSYRIFDNGKIPVTTNYVLGTTETPVGQVFAEVSYRRDCDFRIDDSEALLSSRFMGADEYFFQPSLGLKKSDRRSYPAMENEHVPSDRKSVYDQNSLPTCEYLSSFYADASSPSLSPLYAQKTMKNSGLEIESSPVESLQKSRPMHVSRNSANSIEGNTMLRRPSVSFQPFKAGSLSSSPSHAKSTQRGENTTRRSSQSSQSSPRNSGVGALVQARNRSSLNSGTPATLRGGPIITEPGTTLPVSSSPKPTSASKYSSSFTRRRVQTTFSSSNRSIGDDDQSSSGKHSSSSSIYPSSMILLDTGIGGISESLKNDDDNISEFLKLLERQKTLKSFETTSEIATKRKSAQLSKYQSLRESHNALTESMSSSTLLNRSSSFSGRQVPNILPMGPTTSISTSSSPGKPVSPYTPHTPAIPSRLSANSIAEYTEPRRESDENRAHQEISSNTSRISLPQPESEPSLVEQHRKRSLSRRTDSSSSITRSTGTYEADDESLLFQMSEIGRDNARLSIDEARNKRIMGHKECQNSQGSDTNYRHKRDNSRDWC